MSRYVIHKDTNREVVVGWDPPMGTFFAHVYDIRPVPDDAHLVAREEELLWALDEGYEMRGCTSIDLVTEALLEQGYEIPEDVKASLQRDLMAAWTPGPLQKALGFTGIAGAVDEASGTVYSDADPGL